MHCKVLLLSALALGLLISILASLGGCTSAVAVMDMGNRNAPVGTGFMIKTVRNGDRERKYSLFIPHGYTPDKRWPTIVFLHGIGEGGTDAEHNLTVGLAPEVAWRAATFPFIVVFPQSATGFWDADSSAATDAIAALDQVERDYCVDRAHVILTGCSNGGYGTWAIGTKYKDHFTALVPLCAPSDDKDVDQLTDIPIWSFHNTGDPFVMVNNSHEMCDAINAHGGNARYTEYVALGHDVWIRAYDNDDLYAWMQTTTRSSLAHSPASSTPVALASVVSPSPLARPLAARTPPVASAAPLVPAAMSYRTTVEAPAATAAPRPMNTVPAPDRPFANVRMALVASH